jgi:ABC-type multidrug transport system fused ATPase/permease subunit
MNNEQTTDRSGALKKSIVSLRRHLTAAQKRQMMGLLVLILFSALFDVFGLASILPLVKLAGDPQALHSYSALQWMYDIGGFTSDRSFMLFLVIGILVFFILKSAFGFFVNYLQTVFSSNVAYHITRRQFTKYFNLDFHRFTSSKSSVITHHVINNPTSYVTWVLMPLIMLISESFIVLLIITGIAIYDIRLFLFIGIAIGPASYLIYALLKNRSTAIGNEMNKLFPQLLATLQQTIGGYIDIKLADRENYYRDKFLSLQQRYHKLNMASYLQNLVPMRANELVALIGVVAIFIYAILITNNSAGAIVMVSLFAAAAYRLMPSLNRIINSMVYLRKNMVAMENLNIFGELANELPETIQDADKINFTESIELRGLSFHFPGKGENVLEDINITVRKGEKIGIVGSSGSGKTTLMNILLRFYTEQSGGIYVDGKKLEESQIRSWRSLTGYVKQDIFLMDASIRDNITLNDENPDEARLQQAIRQASLETMIQSLPEGLETVIGEKGSRLSGGQRQRISIARSLYRNAGVLIFDEATSALDNQTEQEVSEAIDSLSDSHKTIFIIAHRITTLRNCDRIYELKNGKINGIFTYRELLDKVI